MKFTITIEDVPNEGVIIICDQSTQNLVAKARSRQDLTVGEAVALMAWSTISDQAKSQGSVNLGGRWVLPV